MRERIETYLVNHVDAHFTARRPTSDVLGMDIVRRTITEVLECAELFKHADPGNANNLGLKTHNGARFPSELIQLRL